MKQIIKALLVLMVGLWLVNCNDPTTIGSGLLDGDQLDLDFTDTITLVGKIVEDGDSIVTYPGSSGLRLESFLVGVIDDEVYGRTESSIFTNPYLTNNEIPKFARGAFFPSAELDSIILVLPWDSLGTYADTLNELYSLEVFELEEPLDREETYYSFQTFAYNESMPIASIENFQARPTTRTTSLIPNENSTLYDTLESQGQLRIRFNSDFENRFFPQIEDDTINFQSDTSFLNFFNGLCIKSASSSSTKGMLSFNLNLTNAGIAVYYSTIDGPALYQFPVAIESVTTAHYEHDYSGSVAGGFLENDETEEDSILFVQGMGGVSAVFEIPHAESWDNIIVNKAELELSILQHPQDQLMFDPVAQLALEEILEDGTTRLINDFGIALTLGNSFSLAFGGNVLNGEKYLVNMSSQFQDMIVGGVSKKIKISVLNKKNRATRTVFYGSKEPETPFKLNLSYTNIE